MNPSASQNLSSDSAILNSGYGDILKFSAWHVIGPFELTSSNSPKDFRENSVGISLKKSFRIGSESYEWRPAEGWNNDKENHVFFDFISFPRDNAFCYAYREIIAPGSIEAYLFFGADDFVDIIFNGNLIYRDYCSKGSVIRSDFRKIKLEKGRNELLLKVGNFEGGYCFNCEIVPISNPDKERIELSKAIRRFPSKKNMEEAGRFLSLIKKGSIPEIERYLVAGFLQTPIVDPCTEIIKMQKCIEELPPESPDKEVLRSRLLNLYESSGVTDIAKRHFLNLVRKNERLARNIFRRGVREYYSGKLLQAFSLFERSLDLYPDFPEAVLYRIRALYHLFEKTEDGFFNNQLREKLPHAKKILPKVAEIDLFEALFNKFDGKFSIARQSLNEAKSKKAVIPEADLLLPEVEAGLGEFQNQEKAMGNLFNVNREAAKKLVEMIEQ